jgi:tellurite resistance protein
MAFSESGERLRKMIIKAIDDAEITRDEYDQIMEIAWEDGHLDNQEKALLGELQNLVEEKMVKIVHK